MKYSNATNYALHTIVYLAIAPAGKSIGVKPLAEVQKLSPTYLSKILTKLVKAGLVESTVGVNGGYRLIKDKRDISFLEVIHAIEGRSSLFTCGSHHKVQRSSGCLIEAVMSDAEHRLEQYLQERSIADIADKIDESMHTFIEQQAQ